VSRWLRTADAAWNVAQWVASESEGKWTMSIPHPSEPAFLRDAASSSTAKPRSRSFWLAVGGGLLVLAIIAVALYYALTGFFSANGTWYGPMRVTSGAATVSIETYMDDSTFFTGSISGKGTFCIPLPFNNLSTFDYSLSGSRAFTLPGRDNQRPITLTAQYTVPLVLGFTLPIGPSLQLHGNVANNTLHLTGGDSTVATVLDMKHGTKADFTAACHALSPLG
jgi:hypothetical protein